MSDSIFFHLTKEEVEVLLAWHLCRDGEDDGSVKALSSAYEALGGDSNEVIKTAREIDAAHDDEDDDIKTICDILEDMVDVQEEQSEALLQLQSIQKETIVDINQLDNQISEFLARVETLDEAAKRCFEDKYPSHWSMLFGQGHQISELFARVETLEKRGRK